MPSAYNVPMASNVFPDPDTPTTATIRHSGTSTSMPRRLFCLAPRTAIAVGSLTATGLWLMMSRPPPSLSACCPGSHSGG